jgi:hypothetical protein
MVRKRNAPEKSASKRPAAQPSRAGSTSPPVKHRVASNHAVPPETTSQISRADIHALAARIQELNKQAVREYAPLVEEILRSDDRDVRRIEQTLDGLLDFCGYPPVLALYRRLCRHYWSIDPAATARYVQFYREMWDSESVTDGTE